jgi:hypothetical protein
MMLRDPLATATTKPVAFFQIGPKRRDLPASPEKKVLSKRTISSRLRTITDNQTAFFTLGSSGNGRFRE